MLWISLNLLINMLFEVFWFLFFHCWERERESLASIKSLLRWSTTDISLPLKSWDALFIITTQAEPCMNCILVAPVQIRQFFVLHARSMSTQLMEINHHKRQKHYKSEGKKEKSKQGVYSIHTLSCCLYCSSRSPVYWSKVCSWLVG
jgi:hypothetical protein